MSKLKILILGDKQHGKTTVGSIMSKLGYDITNTSWFIAETFAFDKLKSKYGYKTVQDCYDDRVNHRQEWAKLINEYGDIKLIEEIVKISDVYIGLRNKEVFDQAKHLFDYVFWVKDPRKPATDSTLTIGEEDADLTIINDTSKEMMAIEVESILFFLEENL